MTMTNKASLQHMCTEDLADFLADLIECPAQICFDVCTVCTVCRSKAEPVCIFDLSDILRIWLELSAERS